MDIFKPRPAVVASFEGGGLTPLSLAQACDPPGVSFLTRDSRLQEIMERLLIIDRISNMKTIAITIDESLLQSIDLLVAGKRAVGKSRSEVIRKAVRDYVSRLERAAEESREREIFRRHRARLERPAAALVREQAKL